MQVDANARFFNSGDFFEEKLLPLKVIRLLFERERELFEEDRPLLQGERDLFEVIRDLLQEEWHLFEVDRDLLQGERDLFEVDRYLLQEELRLFVFVRGSRFHAEARRRGESQIFLSGLETRPIPSDRRTRAPNCTPSPTSHSLGTTYAGLLGFIDDLHVRRHGTIDRAVGGDAGGAAVVAIESKAAAGDGYPAEVQR